MKNIVESRCGTSLIISSLLMMVTMVLHPAGGSVEHLIDISAFIIITHSIALVSIPFGLLGFWGVTKRLGSDDILPIAAFITMGFGMVAVMGAATVNGLALPMFVTHYEGATLEKLQSIKPVLNYNTALNHAFDYIYMGAACGSILLWSIAILKTGRLPKFLGWLGIILTFSIITSMMAGFIFTSLTGFRIFVSGFIIWIILSGLLLRRNSVE